MSEHGYFEQASTVTVEVADDGKILWAVRDDDGILLTATRLDPQQAINLGTKLLNAAVEVRG